MHPVGAILTILFSLVTFVAPRRLALMGVMAAICYITQAQQVVVGGFHFTALRVVLLFGFIRCVARGELKRAEFNPIDKALFIFLAVINFIIIAGSGGDMTQVVYQSGMTYNILLGYLVFKCLIRNQPDLEDFISDLSILIIPFTLFMVLEGAKGVNIFSVFGGVDSMFRDGHYRAEAAFRSPITAGTLGATLMPLFLGLYLIQHKRFFAILGMACATIIVVCSRSSGPLLAFGSAILGFLFWRWREKMKKIRWTLAISLISLHLYMKAPVWFLMGHISDIVGGGGWYRAVIVDQAVNHFSSWWLCGTSQTGDWMATQLQDGAADLTNEFVATGVRGGLLSLILFILIIVRSFRYLGLAMKKLREVGDKSEMLLWALGSTLFATIVNFFSVSYFDQIQQVWFMLLAIISAISFDVLGRYSAAEPSLEKEPEDLPGIAVETN